MNFIDAFYNEAS